MAAHAVCRRILLLLHLILQHHIPPVFLRRDAADAPEDLHEILLILIAYPSADIHNPLIRLLQQPLSFLQCSKKYTIIITDLSDIL